MFSRSGTTYRRFPIKDPRTKLSSNIAPSNNGTRNCLEMKIEYTLSMLRSHLAVMKLGGTVQIL